MEEIKISKGNELAAVKERSSKTTKYIVILIFILLIFIVAFVTPKIRFVMLKNSMLDVYTTEVNNKLKTYGIEDAKIVLSHPDEIEKTSIYFLYLDIITDEFVNLEALEALNLLKEMQTLEECYHQYIESNELKFLEKDHARLFKDQNIIFSVTVNSNNVDFVYDKNEEGEKSYSGIEYIKYEKSYKDNGVALAYKDEKIVYNIFESKEYMTLDRETIENRDDYANTGYASSYINQSNISSGNSQMVEIKDNMKSIIWTCAQDIVKGDLKSPSTAKFGSYNDVKVYSNGGNDYTIIGSVEAQNSFGAVVEQGYIVTLTYTGSGYKNGAVVFN